MKKTSKAIISLVLCLCIIFSGGAAFADVSSSKITTDELKTAVEKKDIDTIIQFYVDVTRNYYRAHAFDENFAYFNAPNYLKMYQDFVPRDEKGALEHYLSTGIFEGRSCGTSNDPYIVLSKYPSLILCLSVLKSVDSPHDFIAALFNEYEKILNSQKISYSSQETLTSKKCTLMFFLTPTGLEYDNGWTTTIDIVRTLCSLYSTPNISATFMLGGTNKWYSTYINDLIGRKGDKPCSNRLFSVDRDALNSVIENLCEKYQTTPEILAEKASSIQQKEDSVDKTMADELINLLLSDDVLIDYGDAGIIEGGEALTNLVKMSSEYQADTMGLIFDGHGAGVLFGGPFSNTVRKSDGRMGLDVLDIVNALKAADVQYSPLDFIVQQSCQMGMAEISSLLKDYCHYLFGAEDETATGTIKFYDLLQNIEANVSSDYLSSYIMDWILDDFVAAGKLYGNTITTAAYSDSDETENAINAYNSVCASLNNIISDSKTKSNAQLNQDEKVIYSAMKIACYNSMHITPSPEKNYTYEDLLDYLIQLKKSLISSMDSLSDSAKAEVQALCADKGELDNAILQADVLTKSNIFNYYGYKIYENREGTITSTTSEHWEKLFGTELCGLSICMPAFYTTRMTAESAKKQLDDIRKLYTQKYVGMGFDDYLKLIDGFASYYLNENEAVRLDKLSKELFFGTIGGVKYTSYSDVLDISVMNIDNSAAIQVKVKPNVVNNSLNSSGNMYVDVIDTLPALRCYLTAKFNGTLKADKATTKNFDVLLSSNVVDVRTQNSSINITSNDIYSISMTYATGSNNGDEVHDWIFAEKLSTDELKAIYSTNAYIKNKIDEIMNKQLDPDDKQDELENLFNNYTVYFGACQTDVNSNISAYHIFNNNDGNYISSASKSGSGCNTINNVSKISFYHKVITNNSFTDYNVDYNGTKSGEVDGIEILEELKSEYIFDSIFFDIGDDTNVKVKGHSSFDIQQNIVNLGYILCCEKGNGSFNAINKSDASGELIIARTFSDSEYLNINELTLKPEETPSEEEITKNYTELNDSNMDTSDSDSNITKNTNDELTELIKDDETVTSDLNTAEYTEVETMYPDYVNTDENEELTELYHDDETDTVEFTIISEDEIDTINLEKSAEPDCDKEQLLESNEEESITSDVNTISSEHDKNVSAAEDASNQTYDQEFVSAA